MFLFETDQYPAIPNVMLMSGSELRRLYLYGNRDNRRAQREPRD